MTFDEIRNELSAIRSGAIMSDAESSILAIVAELTDAVESLSVRLQEQRLRELGINTEIGRQGKQGESDGRL